MLKLSKIFLISIIAMFLFSCSDKDDSNTPWSKMSADQKANRLDAQMADRFNYLNKRINELEVKVRNLENNR